MLGPEKRIRVCGAAVAGRDKIGRIAMGTPSCSSVYRVSKLVYIFAVRPQTPSQKLCRD